MQCGGYLGDCHDQQDNVKRQGGSVQACHDGGMIQLDPPKKTIVTEW